MRAYFHDLWSIFRDEFETYASTLQMNTNKAKELGLEKFLVKSIVSTAKKEQDRRNKLQAKEIKAMEKQHRKALKKQSKDTGSEASSLLEDSSELRSNAVASPGTRTSESHGESPPSYTTALALAGKDREKDETYGMLRKDPEPVNGDADGLEDISAKYNRLAAEHEKLQRELADIRKRQAERYVLISLSVIFIILCLL